MPVPKKVITYLDNNNVKYDIVEHRTVYTAYDAAATLGVELTQIAKSLMVKAGKDYVMILLPASRNVDFDKLAKVLEVSKVSLPKEKALQDKLKIKPGFMTGFAGMYKVKLIMDKSLQKEKNIIVSSGSTTESIKMTVTGYTKLEDPHVASFSVVKKVKKTQKPKAKVKKQKPKRKSTSKK